jgi:hypothetical protein
MCRINRDLDIITQLKEADCYHAVVAIGFKRDLSNQPNIRIGGYQMTLEDMDNYDRITGEIAPSNSNANDSTHHVFSFNCYDEQSASRTAVNTCNDRSYTDVQVDHGHFDVEQPFKCSSDPSQRGRFEIIAAGHEDRDNCVRGVLFGGGIAFPQDLDEGGDIQPFVGFQISVRQTDLMVTRYYECNKG